VGYRSVSQIIPTPSPQLFRRYFPRIKRDQFNYLFNRYATFAVADVTTPTIVTPDYVQLPLETMSRYAAVP